MSLQGTVKSIAFKIEISQNFIIYICSLKLFCRYVKSETYTFLSERIIFQLTVGFNYARFWLRSPWMQQSLITSLSFFVAQRDTKASLGACVIPHIIQISDLLCLLLSTTFLLTLCTCYCTCICTCYFTLHSNDILNHLDADDWQQMLFLLKRYMAVHGNVLGQHNVFQK